MDCKIIVWLLWYRDFIHQPCLVSFISLDINHLLTIGRRCLTDMHRGETGASRSEGEKRETRRQHFSAQIHGLLHLSAGCEFVEVLTCSSARDDWHIFLFYLTEDIWHLYSVSIRGKKKKKNMDVPILRELKHRFTVREVSVNLTCTANIHKDKHAILCKELDVTSHSVTVKSSVLFLWQELKKKKASPVNRPGQLDCCSYLQSNHLWFLLLVLTEKKKKNNCHCRLCVVQRLTLGCLDLFVVFDCSTQCQRGRVSS